MTSTSFPSSGRSIVVECGDCGSAAEVGAVGQQCAICAQGAVAWRLRAADGLSREIALQELGGVLAREHRIEALAQRAPSGLRDLPLDPTSQSLDALSGSTAPKPAVSSPPPAKPATSAPTSAERPRSPAKPPRELAVAALIAIACVIWAAARSTPRHDDRRLTRAPRTEQVPLTPAPPPVEPARPKEPKPWPRRPVRLQIRAPESLRVNDRILVAVDAFTAAGVLLEVSGVRWSSSDPNVLLVAGNGVVSGASTGEATLRATLGALEDSAPLRVLPPLPNAISLAPRAGQLQAGDLLHLQPSVFDAEGQPLDPPKLAWTSDDPAIAVVDARGTVTARARGRTVIRVTTPNGVEGRVNLSVLEAPCIRVEIQSEGVGLLPGQGTTLTAVATDARGARRNLSTGARWTSSAAWVASVTDGGVVVAQRPGVADIGVQCDLVMDSVRISVVPMLQRIVLHGGLPGYGAEPDYSPPPADFRSDRPEPESPVARRMFFQFDPSGALSGTLPADLGAQGRVSLSRQERFVWQFTLTLPVLGGGGLRRSRPRTLQVDSDGQVWDGDRRIGIAVTYDAGRLAPRSRPWRPRQRW